MRIVVGQRQGFAWGASLDDDIVRDTVREARDNAAFGDVDERVFEVSLEELLGRDPDVLVLLHSDGDPAEVEEAIELLPGADGLTAVTNGDVMTQLFNFTEPPTPLSVEGLERIVARFGGGS